MRVGGVEQLEFEEFYAGSRDACLRAVPAATGDARPAAFSVDTNADGTVTVKVTKEESLDPVVLQRTLADAGIPARVTVNEFCEPMADTPGWSRSWSWSPTNMAGRS
ncbi:hypothetical protein ACIBHX_10360 [Nonomuraea sp. NPDC050536]|uniref:hypothetical protein n=1 Tax=Nonomuraea sp. NPDC050536 TaxID=3364366 RepID=UPI0037C7D83A